VASGEFMRLANVDHRAGVSADGVLEILEIDGVRISALVRP
jgi:hypothetical protein